MQEHRNVQFPIPMELAMKVDRCAARSDMSKQEYMRACLVAGVESFTNAPEWLIPTIEARGEVYESSQALGIDFPVAFDYGAGVVVMRNATVSGIYTLDYYDKYTEYIESERLVPIIFSIDVVALKIIEDIMCAHGVDKQTLLTDLITEALDARLAASAGLV